MGNETSAACRDVEARMSSMARALTMVSYLLFQPQEFTRTISI